MFDITTKEQEFTGVAQRAISTANSLEIQGEDDLRIASDLMNGFKKAKQSVVDFFKPIKDDAFKVHRGICDREKVLLTPYDEADKAVKGKVTAYNAEQRRLAEIAQAQMKQAQEQAAAQALAAAVKAECDGDKIKAETLLKQAEITETMTMPTPTQSKVDGISYRTTYEVVITDESLVPCEVGGVCIRPVDMASVKKLAQMAKGKLTIPGVEIKTVQTAYSR